MVSWRRMAMSQACTASSTDPSRAFRIEATAGLGARGGCSLQVILSALNRRAGERRSLSSESGGSVVAFRVRVQFSHRPPGRFARSSGARIRRDALVCNCPPRRKQPVASFVVHCKANNHSLMHFSTYHLDGFSRNCSRKAVVVDRWALGVKDMRSRNSERRAG